ncbi:LamG-like jellyroll fold domain-containing protein [Promicromonospora sukumoe]|uniref:LamG-like jellyroll fold domain-containing protein n=1 Tax=Promicromonospora sukumoe TaxID=88382 RepID=UPI00364FC1BA
MVAALSLSGTLLVPGAVAAEYPAAATAAGAALSAPTITPVVGYPAVYEQGAYAGGPFVPGAFALDGGGDDIAYYNYRFSPGPRGEIAPGELLEFVPEHSRTTDLTVSAVDSEGRVSSAAVHSFNVDWPVTAGRWLFDEGQGGTAASEEAGDTLALSSLDLWGPGSNAELFPDDDFGLVLDEPADSAVSSGPVVDPTALFTVSAVVNPDGAGTGRVVSQGSDFELAVATSPECPTATGTCWAFTVATGSGDGSTTTYADAEPLPGVWNTVTAIRNPYADEVRMYFCESYVDVPRQVAQGAVDPLDAGSGAPLLVGGSNWSGTVDHVRVLKGAPDVSKIMRWCFGSTGP